MKTLYELVKDYLTESVEEYEGQEVYGVDLADLLTSNLQTNGTIEYFTAGTLEKIAKRHNEYAKVFEHIRSNYGSDTDLPNILAMPERFDVEAYYIVAGDILSKIPLVDENWDDEFELNKENINTIQKAIKDDDRKYY